MEIKREVEVILTAEEITQLIKDYLRGKNIEIIRVRFNVEAIYDKDDWQSQYPPNETFTKAIATGIDINNGVQSS